MNKYISLFQTSSPSNQKEYITQTNSSFRNYCRYTDSSLKDCWHGNLKYRTSKVLEKIEDLYGVLLHINHWRHFNEGGDDGGSSGWMGDGGSGSSVDVRNKGGLEGGGERQVKNDDGRRSQGGDNGANNTSSSPSTNTSKGYEKNSVKNVSKSDEQTMMEGVLEERRKEKGMVRKDVMGKIISLIYGEVRLYCGFYCYYNSSNNLFLHIFVIISGNLRIHQFIRSLFFLTIQSLIHQFIHSSVHHSPFSCSSPNQFQHQKHLYEKIHSTQPLFLPSIPCEVFCEYYLHTWMLIALVSFSCNILLVLFIFFSNLRSSTQTFVSL